MQINNGMPIDITRQQVTSILVLHRICGTYRLYPRDYSTAVVIFLKCKLVLNLTDKYIFHV